MRVLCAPPPSGRPPHPLALRCVLSAEAVPKAPTAEYGSRRCIHRAPFWPIFFSVFFPPPPPPPPPPPGARPLRLPPFGPFPPLFFFFFCFFPPGKKKKIAQRAAR